MFVALFAVWPPIALHLASLSVAAAYVLPWPLRAAAIVGAAILVLDIAARIRDFRKVAGVLRYDPSLLPRHVARYKRSWCQRTVLHWAAFAALGQGGSAEVRSQYEGMGYRWYHVFPDRTFTRDSPFLKANFWRGLIGGTPAISRDPAE